MKVTRCSNDQRCTCTPSLTLKRSRWTVRTFFKGNKTVGNLADRAKLPEWISDYFSTDVRANRHQETVSCPSNAVTGIYLKRRERKKQCIMRMIKVRVHFPLHTVQMPTKSRNKIFLLDMCVGVFHLNCNWMFFKCNSVPFPNFKCNQTLTCLNNRFQVKIIYIYIYTKMSESLHVKGFPRAP